MIEDKESPLSLSLQAKKPRSDSKERKIKHFKDWGHIFHAGSKKKNKQLHTGTLSNSLDHPQRRATFHDRLSPCGSTLHEDNNVEDATQSPENDKASASLSPHFRRSKLHSESGIESRNSLPTLEVPLHSLASLITILPTQAEQKEANGDHSDIVEAPKEMSDTVLDPEPTTSQWDENEVDIEVSESALRHLDATVKQLNENLAQMHKDKQNGLTSYLITLDHCLKVDHESENGQIHQDSTLSHPKEESNKSLRNTFEDADRQYSKRSCEIQEQLLALECMRQHIEKCGVPKGRTEKEYLKWLRKCRDQGKSFSDADENASYVKRSRRQTMPVLKTTDSSGSSLPNAPRASFWLPSGHLNGDNISANTPKGLKDANSIKQVSTNGSEREFPLQSANENTSITEQTLQRRQTPLSVNSKHSIDSIGVMSLDNDNQGHRKSIASSSGSPEADWHAAHAHSTPSFLWQSKFWEEMQSLRGGLSAAKDSNRALEEQLAAVQQESDGTRNRIARRVIEINGKIEGSDARLEEFHKQAQTTMVELNNKLRNIEQHFELRFITLSRKLEDQVESVKNRLEQIRISVNSLSDPEREQMRWYQFHRSEHTLHNHLLTSLLHLFAFLAILLSSSMHFILKAINCAAHLMQQRFGPAVVLLALSIWLGIYFWSPGIKIQIHDYVAPLWTSVKHTFPLPHLGMSKCA